MIAFVIDYGPYLAVFGSIALVCLVVFFVGYFLCGDGATAQRLRNR